MGRWAVTLAAATLAAACSGGVETGTPISSDDGSRGSWSHSIASFDGVAYAVQDPLPGNVSFGLEALGRGAFTIAADGCLHLVDASDPTRRATPVLPHGSELTPTEIRLREPDGLSDPRLRDAATLIIPLDHEIGVPVPWDTRARRGVSQDELDRFGAAHCGSATAIVHVYTADIATMHPIDIEPDR